MKGEHAHSRTLQPGVAGRSRNPSPNTHTHTAHPCQEWLCASGAHTQPNTPARSGGTQPKPSPNTHTHTAHPCQEWLGASGARTQPNSPARNGGAQLKPDPKHTHPHRPPVPGVAGCKRSTHKDEHPSQELRGAAETRAQTHTPTRRTPARSGWVQAEHTHSPTPQPGVAGRSRNPSPNTHTHTAHPCKEWLGGSGARTQPNTPARSGGAQPKREPKHTQPPRALVPGVAG